MSTVEATVRDLVVNRVPLSEGLPRVIEAARQSGLIVGDISKELAAVKERFEQENPEMRFGPGVVQEAVLMLHDHMKAHGGTIDPAGMTSVVEHVKTYAERFGEEAARQTTSPSPVRTHEQERRPEIQVEQDRSNSNDRSSGR